MKGNPVNQGKRDRDKGIAKVVNATDEQVKKEFWRVVKYLTSRDISFTSEEVRKRMKVEPTRPNSLPGLMQQAVKRYDLVAVGYVLATRVSARAHRLVLWQKRDIAFKRVAA